MAKPLSASRIKPGTYTVDVEGIEFSLARQGSTWAVWERSATWDRDGFDLKRDAMRYLEEIRRGLVEERAWERRLRQQRLAESDHQYVWIEGFGEDLPKDRGAALRAVFDDGACPTWVGQHRMENGFLADLIHWRGDPEDLDRQALRALGGDVVAEGRSVEVVNSA